MQKQEAERLIKEVRAEFKARFPNRSFDSGYIRSNRRDLGEAWKLTPSGDPRIAHWNWWAKRAKRPRPPDLNWPKAAPKGRSRLTGPPSVASRSATRSMSPAYLR